MSEGTVGGFKEAVIRLEGEGVFGWLKFERVCTACNAFQPRSLKEGCTQVPRRLPCFLWPAKSMSN